MRTHDILSDMTTSHSTDVDRIREFVTQRGRMDISAGESFSARMRPWGEAEVRTVQVWLDSVRYINGHRVVNLSDQHRVSVASLWYPMGTDVTVAMMREDLAR